MRRPSARAPRVTLALTAVSSIWLGLTGCDKGQPAKQTQQSERADADARDETPDETPPEEAGPEGERPPVPRGDAGPTREQARKKLEAVSGEDVKKNRKQLLDLVNEGRKLVKDGKHAEAIAKYEAALKLDPNYRPALGEMGWAQFNHEQYDQAHSHTLLALDLAETDKQRGMLLYNLGRIAEARGDDEDAMERYQLSLEVRPNKVVQERLDGLVAQTPSPPDATQTRGLRLLGSGFATLQEACDAAGSGGECGENGGPCELGNGPSGDPDHYGVMSWTGDWFIQCHHPIVKTSDGWAAFDSAHLGQHGSEIDEGVDEIETRLETNETGTHFVMEFQTHQYDRASDHGMLDPETMDGEGADDPDLEFIDESTVVFCKIEPTPACTLPIAVDYRRQFPNDNFDESYKATVKLEGDAILIDSVEADEDFTYTQASERWSPTMRLAQGTYAFSDLARAPQKRE